MEYQTNVYVGLTDWDWYDYLKSNNATEANFWKPTGKPFKALNEGDLFLFKLKAAHGGQIAGGGFFVDAVLSPSTGLGVHSGQRMV